MGRNGSDVAPVGGSGLSSLVIPPPVVVVANIPPVPKSPPRRFFFPLFCKGSRPFACGWDAVASARPYRFAGCCRTGGKWCAVTAKVLYHLYYTLCVLQAVKPPPEIIPPRPICRRRASIRARFSVSNMFYILLFCPKTRNAVFCPISDENTL